MFLEIGKPANMRKENIQHCWSLAACIPKMHRQKPNERAALEPSKPSKDHAFPDSPMSAVIRDKQSIMKPIQVDIPEGFPDSNLQKGKRALE